jgi:fucose 4-O-acetylase-like acetyltransferase
LQLKRIFPLYILLQTIAVLLGKGIVNFLTPWWILWYLLSYSIWLCLAWLWLRFCKGKWKFLILICTIIVGCLGGFLPWIGRVCSLSRTLVFFPYFFTGVIINPSFHWKRLRLAGIFSFMTVFVIMLYMGKDIPVPFLYQATPYENEKGIIFRLICYFIGGLWGLFFLSFTPNRRLPFSKIGGNTMLLYLLHAPIALWLRKFDIAWPFYIFIAVGFLYIIHILTKWHGTLYGIVSTERRDNTWQPFKKSMKNIHRGSTDSYYP